MADSYIQVPPDSTGKKVDTDQVTTGSGAVERHRMQISGTGATQIAPVSATDGLAVDPKTLPPGAATAARQDTGNTSLASIDGKNPALVGGRVPVDPSGVTSPVSAPALGAVADARATDSTSSWSMIALLKGIWQLLSAGNNVPATTSTLSNVADNASSTTVLASNAARLGFTLYNDSTVSVYVKLGTTASASSFTRKMLPGDYWGTQDLGANYNGRIDAIWVSAPGGFMRVTELTA